MMGSVRKSLLTDNLVKRVRYTGAITSGTMSLFLPATVYTGTLQGANFVLGMRTVGISELPQPNKYRRSLRLRDLSLVETSVSLVSSGC